ncbi:MAG: hypothetical protein GY863_06970, partial [bacterium]|nr:hypothetical protein [bacterium]
GPGCPICSGSGSNTESLLAKGVVLSSVLMIPEGEEDTFIPTFKTAIHNRVDVGIGYLNKTEEVIWSARVLLLSEKENSPGIIMGSGSVRMGGSDQSVFLAATKNFEDNINVPVRLTLGAASILSDMDKMYFIGHSVIFTKKSYFRLLPMMVSILITVCHLFYMRRSILDFNTLKMNILVFPLDSDSSFDGYRVLNI